MQLTPPFHHHWKSSSTFFGEYLGQFLLVELRIYILKYTLQALHIAPFLLLTRPTVLYSQLLHIVLIYPFVLLSRSFLGQRLLTISWIATFWDFDLSGVCSTFHFPKQHYMEVCNWIVWCNYISILQRSFMEVATFQAWFVNVF